MSDYNRFSSVSNMLETLNWPTLELRRKISRLQTFYKGIPMADPAPPPPSRNCIQDRDTLIEQSITLIKQSQCS